MARYLGNLIALTTKDMRLLLRDRAGFFVTFVFPLVYAAFFGAIIGSRAGIGTMRIGVVTPVVTPMVNDLVSNLQASEQLETVVVSKSEAESRLRAGRLSAIVTLQPAHGIDADPDANVPPTKILLQMPPNRPVDTAVLKGHLYDLTRNAPTTSLNPGCAIMPHIIDVQTPADRDVVMPPQNQFAVAFPQGIIWGVLGCTAAFSLSIVIERKRGTLVRLQAAPVTRATILTGKAGACVLTNVMLSLTLYAVAVGLFGVRPLSYAALVMTIFSVSIGFVGIMMLLSVLGQSEQAASGITWSVLLAMAMVGGGMVPHFFMPIWIQEIGAFSPVRWAIVGMEEAVWRGGNLAASLKPCSYLILCGAVCFILGARAFRWSDKCS